MIIAPDLPAYELHMARILLAVWAQSEGGEFPGRECGVRHLVAWEDALIHQRTGRPLPSQFDIYHRVFRPTPYSCLKPVPVEHFNRGHKD